MTETKQELQRIIDAAPDDSWTHYKEYSLEHGEKTVYLRSRKRDFMIHDVDGWLFDCDGRYMAPENSRSRADIEAQIKLMEEVERLEGQVNELSSLVYNAALGAVMMIGVVDIEGLARSVYGITGVNSEDTRKLLEQSK